MQFKIDGRFLAELHWENNAWTVSAADTGTLPSAGDVADFASAEDNDVAAWLESIYLESADKPQGDEPTPD